jgi:hypothetical protein
MKNRNETTDHRLLKQGDWAQDLDDVRRRVMAEVDTSVQGPSKWRARFVPLSVGFAVLLIAMGGWVGFAVGPFAQHEKDEIAVTIQPEPIEEQLPETVLASAETSPLHEPTIAMQILTDDPNVIILLVD